MHESSLHDKNSFLTLTYDNDKVPEDFSLNHNHIQLFMKRLRRQVGKIRFFMCGEYGEKTSRPHYHICLFGEDFTMDREVYSVNNGNTLYSSRTLDDVWGLGSCQIGDLSVQSASYVARYVVNKQYGDLYEIADPATGEIFVRTPPYCKMSLKPGIGREWINKYHPEVYNNNNDTVYADGTLQRPPRYYDKIAENNLGINIDNVREKRVAIADKMSHDATADRLAVRERVKLAQVSKLRRSHE